MNMVSSYDYPIDANNCSTNMAQEAKATSELVQHIKAHALRNYEKGWDTVVECYSDEDIAKVIGNATTKRGAMAKMRTHYLPYKSYADDIKATAF